MKFLKNVIGRKREEPADEQPRQMSIETLQADLDHSGLDRSLRDPAMAWSEKAAQRPGDALQENAAGADTADDDLDDTDWDETEVEVALEEPFDAARARRQTRPVAEDDVSGSDDGFEEFEDEEFEDEFEELDPEEERAIRDNALLVDEIRDAIAAVRHIESDDGTKGEAKDAKARSDWENDEVFGRKALARERLARLGETEEDVRILEETNHKMFDDDAATRRRQAMAHLKAAAAATKADRVLKRVVGRDPAMDPEQQVRYREDLADVVRARGPRSEPVSRPLSRPRTRPQSLATPVSLAPASAARDPMTYEQLREAFSREEGGAETPGPSEETQHQDTEPAEAKMDIEKIDLKTALERQKAILKAEREALEAEMAGKSTADARADEEDGPDLDTVAEDDFVAGDEPAAEIEPVAEIEPAAEIEPVAEIASADTAETRDESFADTGEDDDAGPEPDEDIYDEWDDGLSEDPAVAAEISEQDFAEEAEDDAPAAVAARGDDLGTAADEFGEEESGSEVAAAPARGLDLDLEADEPAAPDAEVAEDDLVASPEAAPRKAAGRVKTRLLGFQAKSDAGDVFAGKAATGAGPVRFPVGWLVITRGPGFGHSFSLLSGVSKIGRGDNQAVQLDFGDTAISRDNHAAVAFDEELNQFFLGHGGKSNVVRLNGKPVLSTEELYDGDEIRIGETTLKFIALCSDEFTWSENLGDDSDHARSA